jgi:hypothetical protein
MISPTTTITVFLATDSLHASDVEALATYDISAPRDHKKKYQPQHDAELSFTKAITNITVTSTQKRRNSSTPVDYSG